MASIHVGREKRKEKENIYCISYKTRNVIKITFPSSENHRVHNSPLQSCHDFLSLPRGHVFQHILYAFLNYSTLVTCHGHVTTFDLITLKY